MGTYYVELLLDTGIYYKTVSWFWFMFKTFSLFSIFQSRYNLSKFISTTVIFIFSKPCTIYKFSEFFIYIQTASGTPQIFQLYVYID